jgi:hypothetical protein
MYTSLEQFKVYKISYELWILFIFIFSKTLSFSYSKVSEIIHILVTYKSCVLQTKTNVLPL